MDIPILFEDEGLLVVDKPAGRLVIAGRGQGQGASLLAELSPRAGAGLYVVHRLDRDTSGVLLFAKDARLHRELCALFESRAVEKRYQALVHGRLEGPLLLQQPLGPFGSGRWGVRPDGKPSTTHARPLEFFGERATLVEARPRTGRRHQVRVHLYCCGHPVVGDPLYGQPSALSAAAPRLLLHAERLCFRLRGRRFEFRSPLAPDFAAFLKRL